MAETLLAILLVDSSAKGSSLVFHWPPHPVSPPRLRRAIPENISFVHTDNPWKSSQPQASVSQLESSLRPPDYSLDPAYRWERPSASGTRDRSASYTHPTSRPSSGRNSPTKDAFTDPEIKDDHDTIFGYSSEFLAGILCPHRSMCHQKFQLVVDDLAFIGHPVCADADGVWRFKQDTSKVNSRGRESRNRHSGESNPTIASRSPSSEKVTSQSQSAWLHTFHFVMVLDLPDPSSSASGNVSKYFDIIYEQIAFTMAAVLFQEQVQSNFVETECDHLGMLKDQCVRKGSSFIDFVAQALQVSSIAPAMKIVYEAIKAKSMAYVTIHDLPLELQLPPYLDLLLHSEEDSESDLFNSGDEEETGSWGPEMNFGWRLPSLVPWKSLLLLDNDEDPFSNLRDSHVASDDRILVDGLIKFLETVSVTLSLADVASLLDWDLESQIYPTVRWLVQHRKAKVVDAVHESLKTVFTLPPKFSLPISQLSAEFQQTFAHPAIPPLPQILSIVSTSSAKQSGNHFYASVVQSKELIPLYHDVVLWMLKREMLITLHLRIRIVATVELKERVRVERDRILKQRNIRGRKEIRSDMNSGEIIWLPSSSERYSQSRVPSNDSIHSKLSELVIQEDDEDDVLPRDEVEAEDEKTGESSAEDELAPSMINDPGRATPLQRRWLAAMSDGKESYIAQRFELINQYFDGKRTDDEILFRAEITRKQLREVLHHYDEYLQTFLHPS